MKQSSRIEEWCEESREVPIWPLLESVVKSQSDLRQALKSVESSKIVHTRERERAKVHPV